MSNAPDGYGFVAGRSRDNARTLLNIAEAQGLEPFVVRTGIGGYYVPVSIVKEYEKSLGAPAEPEPDAEEEEETSEQDGDASVPDDTWKVADLKAYAQDNEVDLGDATKKADILAAIRSADKEE